MVKSARRERRKAERGKDEEVIWRFAPKNLMGLLALVTPFTSLGPPGEAGGRERAIQEIDTLTKDTSLGSGSEEEKIEEGMSVSWTASTLRRKG